MQRRVLLQSSMGLLMLSPWGFVRSGETLPSDAEVISSFGWATDVHHCRKSPDFWDGKVLPTTSTLICRSRSSAKPLRS